MIVTVLFNSKKGRENKYSFQKDLGGKTVVTYTMKVFTFTAIKILYK
jgi:hypothetical protein